MSLKENIKSIRKEKKISQKELAASSGLSFSMISKLESGEQSNPTLETIEKIASALGVEPFELMGWSKLSEKVFRRIQQRIEELQSTPATYVHQVVHELIISDAGTEFFEINHNAISPDELDEIERDIINFIMYQFSKLKGKPTIYKID
jgi:transcriptional regulator with XRE-family HTH domain